MQQTRVTSDHIIAFLAGRQNRGTPWTTATQVCDAFGYDRTMPQLEQRLRKLLAEGRIQRRPYEGAGRSRWEYAWGETDGGLRD